MKQTKTAEVLIVDDEERNRKLLRLILQGEGYQTWESERGEEALAVAAARQPDVVLLDLMLPGMDGFQVLRLMKENPAIQNIPVVVVTAVDDPAARSRVERAGAAGFITKPIDRWEVASRIRDVLALQEPENRFTHQLAKALGRPGPLVQDDLLEVGQTLSALAEHGDHGTLRHLRRMSGYMRVLATDMGLPVDQVRLLSAAVPLHDVGMVMVPAEVRRKMVPLTADEWTLVRRHPVAGADLLSLGSSPVLRLGAEIARAHHERWDGSGYPDGLAGEEIPLSARLTHLCDCYDALRRPLPYRAAMGHEAALAALAGGDARGQHVHFDPAMLALLTRSAGRLQEIYEQLPDI